MASSISYKGYKSPTLHLVLLVFATGTALLCFGKIDQSIWSTGVLGGLMSYITAGGFSKAAEAFANRNVLPSPPPSEITQPQPTSVGMIP